MSGHVVPDLPAGPANVSAEAQALHDESIVIDGCTFFFDGYGPLLRASGLTASNYTVPLPMDDALEGIVRVKEYYKAVARDPDTDVVYTADDIRRLKAEKRYGVIIGSQNARIVGNDPAWLELYQRLGLRVLQLTYNERNFVGDGCLEPNDAGLSHFGKRLVREANRLGVTVDLSHASLKTTFDAVQASEKPVIVSHIGVSAIVPGSRSLPDDAMVAVARTGGVIGVTSFPKVHWRNQGRRPSFEDFLDALEHVIRLVGIDHVSYGSDYVAKAGNYPEWVIRYLADTYAPYRGPSLDPGLESVLGGIDIHDEQLEGFAGIHHLPRLTEALLRRGYSPQDVQKVLGGNLLRVFEETWAA
jgi:membrane dipeptidase